jgi:hypothetical protein
MARFRKWTRSLQPLWRVLAVVSILLLILFLTPLLLAAYGIKDSDKGFADENALRTTLAVLTGALVAALTLAHNRQVLQEAQRQNSVLPLAEAAHGGL